MISAGIKPDQPRRLRVALMGPWRVLNPYLQHTLYGDLLLSNQYEPLVANGPGGEILPLAAKSWTISEDRRVYRFIIDTHKRFSDGTPLSAQDFKNSWEKSLSTQSMSMNESTKDVLYLIKGVESFKTTKTLKGVKVISNDTLEIEFSRPFRMALYELAGVRYAPTRQYQGQLLGTGAFVISELHSDAVLLKPNPHHDSKYPNEIEVSVQDLDTALANIENDNLDLLNYALPNKNLKNKFKDESLFKIIEGPEAARFAICMNQEQGRIFSDLNMRKALQALVHDHINELTSFFSDPDFFSTGAQVYLPFQSGSLSADEVTQLVEEGRPFIGELIKRSASKPIVFLETEKRPIKPVLEKLGLAISDKSVTTSHSDFIKQIYERNDYDVVLDGFSVSNGDPDGLYHRFGPHAALAIPIDKLLPISNLLEAGRRIIDRNLVRDHYQQVSRRLLDDVPIVHLGVNHSITIMSQDRVETQLLNLKRNNGHLFVYKLK